MSSELIQPDTHPDFVEGYMDGRNADCPEPNENRSERYKHSFIVVRSELTGDIIAANVSIKSAFKASEADDARLAP